MSSSGSNKRARKGTFPSLNVIVPMAGLGSRFAERGFSTPKHLIEIAGKTMIEWAVTTLEMPEANFFFVLRKAEGVDNTELRTLLEKMTEGRCKFVEIDYVTEGPACSALLMKEFINDDVPLVISNCDQVLKWDGQAFLEHCKSTACDGCVLTYKPDYELPPIGSKDKHSFIELDKQGNAVRLAEKEVLSEHVLVGVHYYSKGRYFIEAAEELITKNERFNNEFYMSATYNPMIQKGLKVNIYPLKEGEAFHPTGTVDDVFIYLEKEHKETIEVKKIDDMWRGWFVGNFEPTAHKVEGVEVGLLKHKKGEMWPAHYHALATEINVLVKGKMKVNHVEINQGDIFTFKPNQISAPVFYEDCEVLCVKIPSIPGDKYCV